MSRVIQFFKKLIGAPSEKLHSPEAIQELRAAFKTRYQSFRLLLTTNNKALEIMTELERALEGNRPFGMSFARSKCTAACVNVYRIVKHLDELAPGKYKDLYDRFRIIQEHVNESLVQKTESKPDKMIVPLSSVHKGMVDLVGGKMLNVAQLKNDLGLPVPNGFVITSAAYDKLLAYNDLAVEIDRRVQSAETQGIDGLLSLSAGIQQLIIDAAVPGELEQAVTEAYRELERQTGPDIRVSLRSSALGEDVAGRAFAGQFRSELNVSSENLLHAYKEVVASKYGLPAVTYRLSRGIPDEEVAMCVGCMAMVNAVAGGVMYSRNPVDIRDRSVLINSVWGLPKAVVDGSIEPDLFVITRESPTEVVRKEIKEKQRQFVCYPEEGVCRLDVVGEKAWAQSITDEQAVALASIAMRLDDYYGSPQDIEWAIAADGSVYLLQCRPLQQWSCRKTASGRVQQKAEAAALAADGGKTASPGVGCGPVFVVRTDADKLRFPESAVLVTAQALPRWAPLLSRASAVVTEVGGVTGHLANVAREFGVPALFGVANAVEKLEEGSLVTVDAEGLAVYRGRVESLLAEKPTRRNLMEGSPIHEALKRAAGHIIPLNLLDPDSPEFHPKKCRTLHDITRFAHEKSVHEMFGFGRDHHFSERSSKQLVCDVPMQWWVINLEDGFDHDVDGKFVHLDNIVSIPMLALWRGITAIPWEGPPPVDTRGFMSVLVQATANPALDPAMESPYAARNYFMLSRHFCSLTSRFGFHFSTVEALVGDRSVENYIGFNFKGGAADLRRRTNRAVLVGSVVEELGFRIEVRGDSLVARLEGRDEEFMKSRLMILGYLIIHTRQLDMVMADRTLINAYRQKLLGQIKTFAS